MAGIPPVLPTIDNQPGLQTPANEWASKTTSALNPSNTQNTAGSINPTTADMLANPHSNVSTPGNEFPGAFKEDKATRGPDVDLRDIAQKASQSVQGAAQTVGEVAASYLPQAAAYLPKSVVDTVSGYLPNNAPAGTTMASTNDIPHKTSLPSTELTGAAAGETSAGVGALPGHLNEQAVSQLPDSRNLTPGPGGVSEYVGSKVEDMKQAAPAIGAGGILSSIPFMKPTDTNLPTSEQPSTTSHGGVGSLPGSTNESGVARLPDEKYNNASEDPTMAPAVASGGFISQSLSQHLSDTSPHALPSMQSQAKSKSGDTNLPSSEQPSTTSYGGVGSLPGTADEAGVARLPDENRNTANTATQQPPTSLPTQESRDASGASSGGGVGALPGDKNETGVAQLPDECREPGGLPATFKSGSGSQSQATGGLKKEAKAGAVADVDAGERKKQSSSSEATTKKEDEGAAAKEGGEEKKKDMGSSTAGGHKGQPNKGEGYDTDYHPADMHPRDEKYEPLKEGESGEDKKEDNSQSKDESEKPNLGATEAQRKVSGPDEKNTNVDQSTGKPKDSTTSSSSPSVPEHKKEGVSEKANENHPSHPSQSTQPQSTHSRESTTDDGSDVKRKASFMDRMKGDMKIMLGKMEGKKGAEKVEEGRRLKMGESPTSAGGAKSSTGQSA